MSDGPREPKAGRERHRPVLPAVVWMPGDVRTEIHITSAETDGAFCLMADDPPVGWALPPHRHEHEAETIFIVSGRFEMVIAGESRELAQGDVAHIPAGVVHSGRALDSEGGRRVVIFSPAGMEEFFLEVGESQPGEPDDVPALLAAAGRYGWDFDV